VVVVGTTPTSQPTSIIVQSTQVLGAIKNAKTTNNKTTKEQQNTRTPTQETMAIKIGTPKTRMSHASCAMVEVLLLVVSVVLSTFNNKG
jgi:1,4-dihydroxy-2-naphthoate octaprenyltransferase